MKSSPPLTTSISCIALTLFSLFLITPSLLAQTKGKGSDAPGPRKFWQASLPEGDYTVALAHITSVSKRTYVIDGNVSITEVIVDTNGNALVRFYFISPIAKNTASGASKQYTSTTHAKMIEYRIANEKDLAQLFTSIRGAWINSSGRKFTIR